MAVERLIGVDFGTSTSVIRIKRYESGKPIGEKLETKEVTFSGSGAVVPTLIMKKDDDASISYFGYEALQKKKKFTNFHSFKMDLESSDPAKRAQARLLTEEFYAYLAKQYKSQSDGGHLGNPDDKERTIISYPVKWSEETKNFMLETAKKVGFPNVTGMDEAQAAIQAVTIMSSDHLQKHGLLKSGVGTNVLLIDMGAGTTDLVLARYVSGDEPKTEVLNTWPKSGEIQFGGREIDNLLQNFFRGLLDEDDAEMVLRRIGSDKFKSWKEETVSPALRNHDFVSDFEVLDSCVEMMGVDLDDYCLDRAAFENCLADYLKQFPELVNGCLQNVGMSGSDVDLVIVTGGHSQWYFVNEMLSGKMPQFGNLDLPKIRENPARIVPISRPQETVALGLAYFDLSNKEPTPEPIVDEVAVPTFAMEITKSFAISSGGISVEGTIALGELKDGDNVYVWDRDGKSVFTGRVRKIMEAGNRKAFLTDDAVAGKGEHTVLRVDGIALEWLPKNAILFKETNGIAHVPRQELVKIIEEWKKDQPPVPPPPPVGDFLLKIDSYQVFSTAQGTVVSGVIEEGSIKTGDRVFVCGNTNNRNLNDMVKKIEKENTFVETAQKGDRVGLLLPFLEKYEVIAGTHLSTKPRENDDSRPDPQLQHSPEPFDPEFETMKKQAEMNRREQLIQEQKKRMNQQRWNQDLQEGKRKVQELQEKLKTAGTTTYLIPQGKSIAGAAHKLKVFFESKKYEAQLMQEEGCFLVQARNKPGVVGKLMGSSKSVDITMIPVDDNQVSIKVSGGKWLDKGIGMAATSFISVVCPIPLIVYGTNAVMQGKLIEDANVLLKKYFEG